MSDVITKLANEAIDKATEIARLKAENARLRELVKHLYECSKHNTCAACDYAEDACDLEYDLRELGIEEDE